LGKLKDARKDFKSVLCLVPLDPEAGKKLKACEKAIREEAFQRAIESEETEVTKPIDVSAMLVESSYDGPRLAEQDGEVVVTMDFVTAMMNRFRDMKLIPKKYVAQMLIAAKKLFCALPSLIRASLPVDAAGATCQFTVCGDTHGQFYDLCNIFEIGGFPSSTNPYLFNGDFVDRGSFSFEVAMTLIAIKLMSPTALHMLRGNHETRNMNKIYGFDGEIKFKYDESVMTLFTDVFNWLPLAAVIQEKVFVVHGGLSTTQEGGVTLAQVESVPRGRDPPESGLMSELVHHRITYTCSY
jgi:serine/threonine-protein phosphatase 5